MVRALIVDDSEIDRRILTKLLADIGIGSVLASNGDEAIEVLRANADVALALVDWNMPVLDGIGFTKQLRQDPKFQRIKIVMVTGNNESDEVADALDAGVDEYLMKPITKETFREKLGLVGFSTGE